MLSRTCPEFRLVAFLGTLMSLAAQLPPTRQDNVLQTFHGVSIVEPYKWLEDSASPETRNWLAAENSYAHQLLDSQPERKQIETRMDEMLRHDRIGFPLLRGDYYFFEKQKAGDELWSINRRRGDRGQDETLIAPPPASSQGDRSVSLLDVSVDGGMLAYSIRQGGEDETEIRIFNVRTRQDLPDQFPRTLYLGFAWRKDARGFYYTVGRRDVGKRLYFHRLGINATNDVEVFGKGYGLDTWIEPVVSENGHYLLINVERGWARGEFFIKDLTNDGPIRELITGIDARFLGRFSGDSLFVQTNWNASRYRIFEIDLHDPSREKWRDVIPATDDAIQEFSVIGGRIFVNYLHNVSSRIRVFALDGKPLGDVSLPGLGTGSIEGRADQNEGILSFDSFTVPLTLYRYNVEDGHQDLWHRDKVPFDSTGFETEQVWYRSKDGTRIPMFLVHKKGIKADGNTPTILYGYGGFGVSITPRFDAEIAWWIEHGGLYAVANIRGGNEFGEEWHKSGMPAKKQNVFDDFIAGAEWLIHNKYTRPSKLAIWGGSNGGLLVAAALTQRPELYQAVVCWHPDLDMIRYYTYTKNNNPPALLEYGNAADPEQFKFLYAYSPYEKVKPHTEYPAVLISSGDADTRVPPEQARKMTARLQAATASKRPILLLYDSNAGHSSEPLSTVIRDATDELTFVTWQLGLKLSRN
jgi:prolyl oligopeptidase